MADNEKLGSTSPQILLKNATNLDKLVNGRESESLPDRFAVLRRTWYGMEMIFNRFITYITGRGEQAVGAIGWQELGNWATGLTVDNRQQIVYYNGSWYKYLGELEHVITGDSPENDGGVWSAENPMGKWSNIGDAALRSNLGSSDGTNLIGGLPFVTPEMFGSSRGDITHDEAFRLMLAAAAVHPTRTAWAPGDYELFDTHILPQGVTLIIDGVIKHNPVGDFTWSESNRRSPYSFLLVTEKNINIKGSGRIENKYEAVSVDAGGDNFKFEGVTVSNPDRSKSVGLSIYNVFNVSVLNCLIANNGSKGTYLNSSSTGITGRYGNGIDAGSIRGMNNSGVVLIDNGANGFWCYGVSDLSFVNGWGLTNGASGFQYGPHPDYDGLTLSASRFRGNAADGVDINYTGTSPVAIDATITGVTCRRNGFYNSDTSKPTADGSGFTLRNVTNYVLADFTSHDNNGVGVYCTYAADANIHDGVIINRLTMSSGMYQGFASTDVSIHNMRIMTKGTCYQEGGSMPVTRPAFHDNKLFSSQAQTTSIPSNTQTDRIWHSNHHVTPNVINFWFSVKDETVRFTGSTGRAVYINANYGKFRDVIPFGLFCKISQVFFTGLLLSKSATHGYLQWLN